MDQQNSSAALERRIAVLEQRLARTIETQTRNQSSLFVLAQMLFTLHGAPLIIPPPLDQPGTVQ